MRIRNISFTALVICAAITLLLLYWIKSFKGSTGPFPMNWTTDIPEDDTSFGGLFATPDNSINDSLPHYKYRIKEDSLKQIFEAKQLNNKSISSGVTYGPIGLYAIRKTWENWWENNSKNDSIVKTIEAHMDSLNKRWSLLKDDKKGIERLKKELGDLTWKLNVRYNELSKVEEEKNESEQLYYLGLNGYHIKDYDTKFFVERGTFNLAYVKWDSVKKRTYDSTKVGHYERKQIPVRFSSGDNRILIPIARPIYKWMSPFLMIISFVWLFLCIYFFIGLPIQILINISKGKAFTRKNIQLFKVMIYGLVFYTLTKILSPYILKSFFRKTIPADFKLQSFTETLLTNISLILIIIAVFITRKAFQRGYRLQQEQDLTI